MAQEQKETQQWRPMVALGAKIVLGVAALLLLGTLVWQGIVASGNPDPTNSSLSQGAVVVNTGLLVFREGLEVILVLAALTASMMGGNGSYRRPIAVGVAIGFLATICTWFIAIAVLSSINAPALDIQAGTGLLAIVVLLIVMNWFFHKVYWTGWISMHNRRKRTLMDEAQSRTASASGTVLGLALLGFSAMYREGFEVVLFLQSMRLQAGTNVVMQGVAIGLAFTVVVGILTFLSQRHLPYKKMLIVTGVLLAGVLIVMVGESIQEMQQAHWIATTPVNIPIPDWMGMWFAIFPNVETILAQTLAAAAVFGSYFAAQYIKVWRPMKRGETPAHIAEQAPVRMG